MSETNGGIEHQLKSAVYLQVSRMVDNELKSLGQDITATPTFVASLVDLVYNQLINLGEDLELFSKHAGRSTVMPADVYMATRKNETLTKLLKEYEGKLDANK